MKIISFNIVACEKKTQQVLIRLYSTVLQGINIPGIRSQQEEQLFCREQKKAICALSAFVNINQKHEQWTNTTRLLLCVKKQTKKTPQYYSAWILYTFIY